MRRTWSDGKKQRLENILGEFLDGVQAASASNKDRRLEREAWEREYREREQRREEMERRMKTERNRRAGLFAQCTGRQRAVAIKMMIREVRRRASRNPERWPSDGRERWISWAEAIANRSDPFENGYFGRALTWTEFDAELDCEDAE